MPTYNFRNKITKEVIEKSFKMLECEEWLKYNFEWEQIHLVAPSIGDPVRLGVKKHDQGFKEVLQKIHSKAPGSILKDNIR